MRHRNQSHRKDRRDFFRKAAMLGAAAVLGGAGGRRVTAAAAVPAADTRKQSRYRLTPHIRKYYRTASL
jgi:hypothetical protein